MKIVILISFTIILTLFLSCEYRKDKLTIKNISNQEICYIPLIPGEGYKTFTEAAPSATVGISKSIHPLVRSSIQYQMTNISFDKKIYIVFFDCSLTNFVVKNLRSVITDERFVTKAYTKRALDSMNWIINYSKN